MDYKPNQAGSSCRIWLWQFCKEEFVQIVKLYSRQSRLCREIPGSWPQQMRDERRDGWAGAGGRQGVSVIVTFVQTAVHQIVNIAECGWMLGIFRSDWCWIIQFQKVMYAPPFTIERGRAALAAILSAFETPPHQGLSFESVFQIFQ